MGPNQRYTMSYTDLLMKQRNICRVAESVRQARDKNHQLATSPREWRWDFPPKDGLNLILTGLHAAIHGAGGVLRDESTGDGQVDLLIRCWVCPCCCSRALGSFHWTYVSMGLWLP